MMQQYHDEAAEPLACMVGNIAGPGLKTVQLTPDGEVTSRKGTFLVDAEGAALVVAAFKKHGTPIPIDYEHQTLGGEFSSPTGRAPASGWIRQLWHKPGRGLLALIEWNAAAKGAIRAGEYLYLSPVLLVRQSDRRVIELHSAALTNKPAIPRMERLAASTGQVGTELTAMADDERTESSKDTTAMDLVRQIAEALGFEAGTKTSEVLAEALKRLMAKPEEEESGETNEDATVAAVAREKLGLASDASADEVSLSIYLLDGRAKATAEAVQVEHEADALVQNYVAIGKLNPHDTPAIEAAMSLARSDPDKLKAMMAGAPSRMPPQGKTTPPDPQRMQRRGVIQKALSVYLSRDDLQRQTSDSAYVNLALREAHLPKLEEGELVKFL